MAWQSIASMFAATPSAGAHPPQRPLFAFASLALFFLLSCDLSQEPPAPVVPVSGKIKIYNSSNIEDAAAEFRDTLRSRGFDILGKDNDPHWANYQETIIAIRNPHWLGQTALRSALKTKNFITLQDTSLGNIDATIYVGKDYKSVLGVK